MTVKNFKKLIAACLRSNLNANDICWSPLISLLSLMKNSKEHF